MKKMLVKGSISRLESFSRKIKNDDSQIVIGRSVDKVWIQNLVLDTDIKVAANGDEVTIKFKLSPGEYLAIMSDVGLEGKKEI